MGNLPSDPQPEEEAVTSLHPLGEGEHSDKSDLVTPSLMRLPPELIQNVAWFINPEALASTSSSLRKHLFHNFVTYYRIVSSLQNSELWLHLSSNRNRASVIQSLTLDNRKPSRTPLISSQETVLTFLDSPPEEELESQLMSALCQMKGLEKLVYRLDPPIARDEFWASIFENCTNVQDLEVADHDDLGGSYSRTKSGEARRSVARAGIHGSSFFNIKNLRRFVWYSSFEPQDFSISVHLGRLETSLIHNNPNLEELRIHYFNSDLAVTYGGTLIANGNWPKLKILELSRFHAGDEEMVASFFDRHPLLEVLELDQVDATSGRYIYLDDLEDDALPNLRRFRGGVDNVIAILRSQRKKVTAIGGLQFDTIMLGSSRPTTWTGSPAGQCLLECFANSNVKDLEGDFALVISDKLDLTRLFSACHKLERLSLSCSVAGYLESYLPAFSQLKSLKCLSFPLQHLSIMAPPQLSNSMTLQARPSITNSIGSRSSTSSSTFSFLSNLKLKAKMLASVCPNLQRIDFGFSGNRTGSVCVIERYGERHRESGLWRGNKEVSEVRFEDGKSWEWGSVNYDEEETEDQVDETQDLESRTAELAIGDDVQKERERMRVERLKKREQRSEEARMEKEINRTRSKAAGKYEIEIE